MNKSYRQETLPSSGKPSRYDHPWKPPTNLTRNESGTYVPGIFCGVGTESQSSRGAADGAKCFRIGDCQIDRIHTRSGAEFTSLLLHVTAQKDRLTVRRTVEVTNNVVAAGDKEFAGRDLLGLFVGVGIQESRELSIVWPFGTVMRDMDSTLVEMLFHQPQSEEDKFDNSILPATLVEMAGSPRPWEGFYKVVTKGRVGIR